MAKARKAIIVLAFALIWAAGARTAAESAAEAQTTPSHCRVASLTAHKKYESIPGGEVLVKSFVCDVSTGVYDPENSVNVRLRAEVQSGSCGVCVWVCDFAGDELYRSERIQLPTGAIENVFPIPAAKKFGHFTVNAIFDVDNKIVGYSQTAFATAPKPSDDRDPYFVVDKNCALPELLPEMRRFGFGTAFVNLPGASWSLHTAPEKREEAYANLARGKWIEERGLAGFALLGSSRPHVKRTPLPAARVKKGQFALSDEDLATIREHARRMAELMKNRISTWIIQEEFDAIPSMPDCRDDFLNYLLANALVTRASTLGIKEGNPSAEVGILGICCSDYMWHTPKFELSRMVLGTNRGLFDFIALDAYTGGWDACRGPYRPPEDLLGTMLRDAAVLSEEYGGKHQSANVERCHALDYAAAIDSDMCRQQAAMTARSMIVNKAVAECRCYSLHLLCQESNADAFLLSKKDVLQNDKMIRDIGLWKAVREVVKGRNVGFVPRPALVAAGTTARELAFTRDPVDMPLKDGAYACVFTRERSGVPVVALWSTNALPRVAAEGGALGADGMNYQDLMRNLLSRSNRGQLVLRPAHVELDLPSGGSLRDIMGNARRFQPGRLSLALDEFPVFLSYDGTRQELDEALSVHSLRGKRKVHQMEKQAMYNGASAKVRQNLQNDKKGRNP